MKYNHLTHSLECLSSLEKRISVDTGALRHDVDSFCRVIKEKLTELSEVLSGSTKLDYKIDMRAGFAFDDYDSADLFAFINLNLTRIQQRVFAHENGLFEPVYKLIQDIRVNVEVLQNTLTGKQYIERYV